MPNNQFLLVYKDDRHASKYLIAIIPFEAPNDNQKYRHSEEKVISKSVYQIPTCRSIRPQNGQQLAYINKYVGLLSTAQLCLWNNILQFCLTHSYYQLLKMNLLKSNAFQNVLHFLDFKDKIRIQLASHQFYDKLIPTVIYKIKIKPIPRVLIIRDNNKLVCFHPSPIGLHTFTQGDELPFEAVPNNCIIEVNNGRIVMFPLAQKHRQMIKETYINDTKDTNEIAQGLITKGADMIQERSVTCILVKVWNHLIYAIGGRADSHCERYDANINQWKPISPHPKPMELQKYQGFNASDKFIYLVGQHHQGILTIWKLDIEKQERDIQTLTLNQQPQSKWEISILKVPNFILQSPMCIPIPQNYEVLILSCNFHSCSALIIKDLLTLDGKRETFNFGTSFQHLAPTQFSYYKNKVFIPLANQKEVLEIDISSERRAQKHLGLKIIKNQKEETDPSKQECAIF